MKKSLNCSVLIVDDDPLVREAFSMFLKIQGIVAYTASEASYAVEIVQRYRPDLVILDLNLGVNDYQGTEVLWNIKRFEETSSTVVLIYTGLKDKILEDLCMEEMGADGYLLKENFDFTRLTRMINSWIRRIRPRTSNEEIVSGPVRFNLFRQRAFAGPRSLPLTPREYNLLFCAVRKNSGIVGWDWLARKLWGMDGGPYQEAPLFVGACLAHLEEKLGEAAGHLVKIPDVGVRWLL